MYVYVDIYIYTYMCKFYNLYKWVTLLGIGIVNMELSDVCLII